MPFSSLRSPRRKILEKKRRTNGFGSVFADILVVVDKPHHKTFLECGWLIKTETETTVTFEYSCKNNYAGDDETVITTLWADLPKGTEDHFEIDWEISTF